MIVRKFQREGLERRQSYHIHQLSLLVISNSHELFTLFDELFSNFRSDRMMDHHCMTIALSLLPYSCKPHLDVSPPCVVDIDWQSVHRTACPTPYPVLYRAGEQFLFLKDIVQGYGIGYLTTPCPIEQLKQVFRNILLPVLFNMLWVRELFFLHAATVALGNKGIVILGNSGKGKTTLLLHLLQAGFQYMADDTVFLRATPHLPELLAFPFQIRVSPGSLKFFSDLRPFIAEQHLDDNGKYCIGWEKISHTPPVASAIPALLLFPEISPERESCFSPLSAIDAAIRCLPDNVTGSEMEMGQKNFEILSRLVQNVPGYRVRLGQDMSLLGQQILELMGG